MNVRAAAQAIGQRPESGLARYLDAIPGGGRATALEIFERQRVHARAQADRPGEVGVLVGTREAHRREVQGAVASGDPFGVASALWAALVSRPALLVESLVLAVVAALLPLARARGLWALAALGAAFMAAALLIVPGVAVVPLVIAVWATCLAGAVR